MVIFDRYSMRTLLAACLVLGTAGACGGDDEPDTPSGGDDNGGMMSNSGGTMEGSGGMDVTEGATFTEVNEEVIVFTCAVANCHGAEMPEAELDLETDPYAALVGPSSTVLPDRALVVPGEPESSYLWEKLTEDPPSAGTIMPQTQATLTDEYLEIVRSWIAAGAQDN